ncbi:MAG: GntR family transcriptional regulator [Bacteroidota bacterium]
MIEAIRIDKHSDVPKYRQLEFAIEEGVADGTFSKNTKLPSINELTSSFGMSRDTVIKAYSALRERGIISSTHGKGYYITGDYNTPKKKVFVLFNELNAYKEVLHKSLLTALGTEVEVDTFFHNHNIDVFEYLIEKSLGHYTHYVIMPTFNAYQERVLDAIQKIPPKKLFLLDRHITEAAGGSTYQDFLNDAIHGFQKLEGSINKYKKVCILYQDSYMHPYATVVGIKKYCLKRGISLLEKETLEEVEQGILYVCLRDTDLVKLVKMANQEGLSPGREYGILSYNDSPMKEIIHEGITVISTDFEAMGRQTVAMILEGHQEQTANPLKIIERNSI